MDTSLPEWTVSVVNPVIPSNVARIVVVPTATVVARPSNPAALLIVAFDGSEESHVT